MSSLRITLSVLAVSTATALGGLGCAAEDGSGEGTAKGENRAPLEERATTADQVQSPDAADEPGIGDSQSAQRRYGGGGGWGGYCFGLENGTYCGGNQVSGDPDVLYQCVYGRKYFRQYCAPIYGPIYGRRYGGGYGGGGGSCIRMPPGIPDYCE